MKEIRVQDAVGQILCHDMMQIRKGEKKTLLFSKGHVLEQKDIPLLKDNGKEYIFVWENNGKVLLQNEAAADLYDLCRNDHMHPTPIQEGQVHLVADIDGLLLVNKEKLKEINSQEDLIVATRHGRFPVKKGEVIAGARVIPLGIDKDKIREVREILGEEKLLTLMPYHHKKVGILTTGNEVWSGRVEDTFTPVIKEKLAQYDTEIIGQKVTDDNISLQIDALEYFLEKGADIILCTGGMSVDPDDRTRHSIQVVSDRVVTYGVPVLPGSMFMLAYCNNGVPILGLPSSVIYSRRTAFDLFLPFLMADVPVTKEDISSLGDGGMCLFCETCTYPNCGFGKY
ncbi:MAG: molybdopterin-binding protein [Lachnospiraceae bacterium]|nr:molybdopterin-binding protein [Lachnospiraceae bacterium]